jgi:catechol 2,3-dioxygenase-like lactoylglutathione lyase family enzyme
MRQEGKPIHHLGRVIDHIHLRVANLEASKRFYAAASEALELPFRDGGDHLTIDEIYLDAATDYVSRIHLAFQARTHEQVQRFHDLTVDAGGKSNGAPGFRSYHRQYYAAFVLDPDGNNIEAVCDAPSMRSADSIEVLRA